MALPATFDKLISKANQDNLYPKLIGQLNKDFLYANLDLDFQLDVQPQELKERLHEVVFRLIQNKFADYLNLLYIVDISEKKVKALDGSDVLKLSEQVTFLILQREWQKVWLKNQYS